MMFCCPSCGREEEILLDRHPRCLFCSDEMISASNYSEFWMSPYSAIKRMRTISERYGIPRAARMADSRKNGRLGRPAFSRWL